MSVKKKSKLRSINIPAWMFVAFALLYDELLFHFWIMEQPNFGRFLCVFLFALSFALFMAFLCSLGASAGFSRILALVITTLFGFLYLLEYFVGPDSFQNFMTFKDIFLGTKNIAGDSEFAGVVPKMVLAGFWRVLLIAAPIVAYGILGHKGRWGRAFGIPIRCILAFGTVFTFCLGYFSMVLISKESRKYDVEYSFNNAVYAFGLTTALRLDLFHGASADAVDGFDINTSVLQTPTGNPTDPTASGNSSDPTDPPVVYGEHKVDIDFAGLAASESDDDIAAVHKYVASLTPSKENEYTGLFKGKNLIFITAEAFSAEVIDKDRTPTLYRLATKGIQFTDYYQPAWGGSTSTGEYSNLTGLVPTNGVDSIQITANNNMYYTIGNQLQRLGYFSAAYHNHTYNYYDRDKTHCNLGYETYIGRGNGMEEGVAGTWPESDLEMMQFTVEKYIDKQPFSIYYMTVSGHALYSQGGNAMSRKNYSDVEDLDCSETVKCYYAANMELEYALEYLVRELERAGIADDTVIVLGTDHYPYGLEKSTAWDNTEDYLGEMYGYEASDCFKRDHSRLIIWSGCLEDRNLVVDTPTYSLDIVPTLSNLFGVEYDSRLLVGRDVFSDELPLALWNSYSWKTDKGTYDSSTGVFTSAPGVTVDEDYVEAVKAVVKNKIYFSKIALNKDYYDKLFD